MTTNEKDDNSFKKSLIFILLKTLNTLINALRLSFVTFAVSSGISLNKFLVKMLQSMVKKIFGVVSFIF